MTTDDIHRLLDRIGDSWFTAYRYQHPEEMTFWEELERALTAQYPDIVREYRGWKRRIAS